MSPLSFSTAASFHRRKLNPLGGKKSLLAQKVAALLPGAGNRGNVGQFGCQMIICAEVLHSKMTQRRQECMCQASNTKSEPTTDLEGVYLYHLCFKEFEAETNFRMCIYILDRWINYKKASRYKARTHSQKHFSGVQKVKRAPIIKI